MGELDIYASLDVTVREFPLKPGHGEADYLLYADGKAIGIAVAWLEWLSALLAGVKDLGLLLIPRGSEGRPWPQMAEGSAPPESRSRPLGCSTRWRELLPGLSSD